MQTEMGELQSDVITLSSSRGLGESIHPIIWPSYREPPTWLRLSTPLSLVPHPGLRVVCIGIAVEEGARPEGRKRRTPGGLDYWLTTGLRKGK